MFLGITFISLYVGVGAAIERFALDKVLHEGRPNVWANTLGIARDFPLFGSGLGTFDAVYPAYELRNLDRHYSHAHNDYLEYLAEIGFIGMLLLMGGILFLLYTTFRVWRERKNPEVKGLVMGGIVAVICMLIHSIADFNLHIPANMLLFTAVLTLVYNTAFYKFMRPSSYR
jgi:O-antigen ligase